MQGCPLKMTVITALESSQQNPPIPELQVKGLLIVRDTSVDSYESFGAAGQRRLRQQFRRNVSVKRFATFRVGSDFAV